MRLLAAALVVAASPAVAGVDVTAEHVVDVGTPAPFLSAALSPAVGFDGTGFWVAWYSGLTGIPQIYAQSVSALDAGTAVTPPLRLAPSSLPQYAPAMGCSAHACLVAWSDFRDSSGSIYAVRLSPAGLLDASPIVVSRDALDGYDVAVASAGDGFLVAWVSGQWQTDVAARVSATGQVLDAPPLLTAAGPDKRHISAAFDGANYVLVVSDFSPTPQEAYRISTTGVVLDAAPLTLQSSVLVDGNREVASDGHVTVTYWVNAMGDVFVSRLDATRTILDPAGILIGTGFDDFGFNEAPAIAAAGPGAFWVTWTTPAGRAAARFYADGGTPDPLSGIPLTTTADLGDIACSAGTCLCAWQDYNIYGSAQAIVARRLVPAGGVLDDPSQPLTPAVTVVPEEVFPAAACNATMCLAAWVQADDPSQRTNVYAVRVALDGGVLDPAPLRLSCDGCDWAGALAAAAAPTQFLIVWSTLSNHVVFGARVSTAGAVLDHPEQQLDPVEVLDSIPLAAAFDGTRFVTAWTGTDSLIHLGTVSLTGTVSAPMKPAPGHVEASPSLTVLGTQVLLTWVDGDPATAATQLVGLFPAATATRFALTPPIANTLAGIPLPAALSSGGGVFAAVWPARKIDDAGMPGDFDVFLTRVTPAGAVLDPVGIGVATGPGAQLEPAVAFDGVSFRAAWFDEALGGFAGATLGSDGGVTALAAIPVQADVAAPVLASPGAGSTMMLYQRFDSMIGSTRVFQRWLIALGDDGGSVDAGPAADGGTQQGDAGMLQQDGGALSIDGGVPPSDGGTPGVRAYYVGCGCGEAPDGAFWLICASFSWAASRARRGSGTRARRP